MKSVLVDGRNLEGIRHNVSIPRYMWALFEAHCQIPDRPAPWVLREWMRSEMDVDSSLAQKWILHQIVKPSLLDRLQSLRLTGELQTDIEDL